MGLIIPRTPEAEKRVRRAIDRLRQDDFFVDGQTITFAGGVISVRVQPPLSKSAIGIELDLGEGLELDGSNQLAIENLTGASKGDIMVFDGAALQRLPVGFDGQALVADSSEPTGLKWSDSSGTGVFNAAAAGALATSVAAASAVTYGGAGIALLVSSAVADGSSTAAPPAASSFSSAFSSAFEVSPAASSFSTAFSSAFGP